MGPKHIRSFNHEITLFPLKTLCDTDKPVYDIRGKIIFNFNFNTTRSKLPVRLCDAIHIIKIIFENVEWLFFCSPKRIFYCFKHFIFLLLLSIILTEFWCRNDLCNVFWFFSVFFYLKILFFFYVVFSLKIALFLIGSWMQATCVR